MIIAGIYIIENLINKKVYIGQSINIMKRFREHKRCEPNDHLSRAFKHYGLDNFSFRVIRELNPNIKIFNILINTLERHYIKLYKSFTTDKGYNKTMGGKDYFNHTEETKLKISRANKGRKHTEEEKIKIRENRKLPFGKDNPLWGRRRAKETIEKQRASLIEFYRKNPHKYSGFHLSDETKKKISESRRNHKEGEPFFYFNKGRKSWRVYINGVRTDIKKRDYHIYNINDE